MKRSNKTNSVAYFKVGALPMAGMTRSDWNVATDSEVEALEKRCAEKQISTLIVETAGEIAYYAFTYPRKNC